MATLKSKVPVVLFGYDSSAFTQKIRLALRLKQIPYTFVLVPSMMPRPILREHFNITYRKIPVVFLGREAYIDTSLITEALEHTFQASSSSQQHQHPSLYPPTSHANGAPQPQRTLIRALTSYWTDRPLFRQTCGLMPSSVWRSAFGRDRAGLIGHTLDPMKLQRKIPSMMSGLDMHLSMLESLLAETSSSSSRQQGNGDGGWVLDTQTPSQADISFFYQLDWCREIARGQGVADLTAGEVADGGEPGAEELFARYPLIEAWYTRTKTYFNELPTNETRVERGDEAGVKRVVDQVKASVLGKEVPLLPTPAGSYTELDERNGLVKGKRITIAPVDTGMNDPSVGRLLAATPEEIVIAPEEVDNGQHHGGGGGGGKKDLEIRLHFPRVEFRARPYEGR